MRAMILAAGLGTRLRPLTFVRPKALVPVMGVPVLELWIWQLHHAGFESVILNAFHLHEKMVAAIEERTWPVPVEVCVEPVLLGTGGGIRNVADYFRDEPFVVVNADIICRTSFRKLFLEHLESGSPVSLLLHDCPAFNNVAVREDGVILGFGGDAKRLCEEHSEVRLLAFTGVHFLHPSVVGRLESGHPAEIIPVYRQLMSEGRPPRALFDPCLYWREFGSVDAYRRLNEELCGFPAGFLPRLHTGDSLCIHPRAQISSRALLKGMVIAGKGTHVEEDAELENVILWDHVRIERNARLRSCIVADGVTVRGAHENEILIEEGL